MEFKQYLSSNAQKVDKQSDKILTQLLLDVRKKSPKLIPLVKKFINLCYGGKRIRGVLIKLGYQLAGGENSDIYAVGAAWEILHTAALVHDDIIDQSPTRRGQTSLYTSLGGGHYGRSQAISLGDIALYLPVKIITDCKFPSDRKIKALNHLSKTVISTGIGQILDVELPYLGKTVKEVDVKQLYLLKTAYYTVAGPLIMGAILAGAKQSLIKALGEFGENLGIAFQIQDDILGVFETEKQTGKSVASDIEEGKNTLLLSYCLKKANINQLSLIKKYYGKGKIEKSQLEKVKKVFKDVGALGYSHAQAREYALRAKKYIPEITKDIKMCKIMTEMTDYLVERSR